jgi:hypothetical protein
MVSQSLLISHPPEALLDRKDITSLKIKTFFLGRKKLKHFSNMWCHFVADESLKRGRNVGGVMHKTRHS